MTTLDSLPADQRAVLQLLLRQGKSYADLSGLLRIDAMAVRQRAHDGIDTLVGDAGGVDADRRAEIADYLLRQQSAPQLAATLEYLDGSAAGRRFARAASDALSGLAKEPLPDVPEGGGDEVPAPSRPARAPRPPREPRAPRPAGSGIANSPAVAALRERLPGGSRFTSSTLAIAGVAVVLVVVIIVLVASSGGGDDNKSSNSSTATNTTSAPVVPVAQVDLRPPSGGNDLGVAFVVRRSGSLYLALQAQGLSASTQKSAYAVWLYTSPSKARFLGFVPTAVGSDGTLQNVSALQSNPLNYSEMLLTRETRENPPRPGNIVLRGRFQKPVLGATGAQGATGALGTTGG